MRQGASIRRRMLAAFVLLALYVLGYFLLYRKGKLEGETSEVIYKFLPKEKKKE